jgi:hypothetical protein
MTELMNVGVLLGLSGLHPSSKGARIKFSGGNCADRPFDETNDLIAGVSVIKAKSTEEAIESAKRVPAPYGQGERPGIEIRSCSS